MRGVSLRIKINVAILLAFVAAALAFGMILTAYMAEHQASSQKRTRVLLAVLAAHRLEALAPLLDKTEDMTLAKGILDRLVRVDGVTEAALFDAKGMLLIEAGGGPALPLLADPAQPLPPGRSFTVSAEQDKLTAILVEPIIAGNRNLGFLRLTYSLKELSALKQHIWLVFGLAVITAYILSAGLLNILLHRYVLRPVDTLRQGLEAVQAGELGHAVPVSSNDALGRMAASFNAMSTRLKETSASLAESRAELEDHRRLLTKRVEERTAELAEANKRLLDEIEARQAAEILQERALALYKAILESTAEAVVCMSAPPHWQVLAYNRRFLDLWKLSENWPDITDSNARLQEILGKLKDTEKAKEIHAALMQDDRNMIVATLELRDGRYLERRSGPIIQGAAYIGRVFSYVDITEEKRREAQLEQARTLAEEASKAKGAFLAVMSHEIRTPLNAIMGLTEMLLAGEATAEQHDHLRTIEESAAHLLGVVNDILDFSKIEAGKLVLDRTDFSLRELINAVARVLNHQVSRKNLVFRVTVQDDVPDAFRGDPGRLRQVLLNLLGNAVKFTAAGTISLDVATAAEPVPEGLLGITVRVADTGIGMDSIRISELFECFQQGPGSISRRFGGTGLGLAISKQIVERMGGHIEVTSREGEGSTFAFTVLLMPGRVETLPVSGKAADNATEAPRRLHILLVEDNALNAAVTRLHMKRMGHELAVASSAREAYVLLARDHYDVVLMDIEMPDIDGITAARTIRAGGAPECPALDPGVPIIAVTAHAVEDVRQQCLEAGMDGFVTKPVNYQLLQQTLDCNKHGTATHSAEHVARSAPVETPLLFDPEKARQGMGISWKQFEGLTHVSFSEGERRLLEAGQALAAGNFDKAAIAAHTFKGTAATLGAYSSRQLAMALEKAVRQGDVEASLELHRQLVLLWEQVREALQVWRTPSES
ncbi:MAG: ATP-binding protein [Solidesulfovibrio sp.]